MVIAIGASAGGIEALLVLLAELPADLAAAVLVVVHLPPEGTGRLAAVLDRAGPLAVSLAEDGAPLRPGHAYAAPPGHHLLVGGGLVRLGSGPPIDGQRPSIDALLGSVAAAYGARSVGVLLSGALDDGTRGMAAIKAAGGTTLLQDPAEARHPSMIRSAQAGTEIDAVLPLAGLARRLVALTAVSP